MRADSPALAGRLVIERGLPDAPVSDASNRLWPLGAQIKGRGFQSMIVEFTQVEIAAFGPWNRHGTDDMLHVLSGQLALHTEGYETAILSPGDTVHFDGTMPHACLSVGPAPCRCLYVFAPKPGASFAPAGTPHA